MFQDNQLQLQLDAIFRRVLHPEYDVPPLPIVDPPAYIRQNPPRRGGRRGRGRAVIAPLVIPRVPENPPRLEGRAERHHRRQALIQEELRNNRERQNENPPVAVVPEERNQILQNQVQPNIQPLDHDPAAPAARNIHTCIICDINLIDHFLSCGHPFCLQCITTIRNQDRPNPSLCPRCRAPFVEPTRIFF